MLLVITGNEGMKNYMRPFEKEVLCKFLMKASKHKNILERVYMGSISLENELSCV